MSWKEITNKHIVILLLLLFSKVVVSSNYLDITLSYIPKRRVQKKRKKEEAGHGRIG